MMIKLLYVLPTGTQVDFEIPGESLSTLLHQGNLVQSRQNLFASVRHTVARFGKTLQPPPILLLTLNDNELTDFMMMLETDLDRLFNHLFVQIPEKFAVLYHHYSTGDLYKTIGISENAMLLSQDLGDSSRIAGVTFDTLNSDFIAYAFDSHTILQKEPSRSA